MRRVYRLDPTEALRLKEARTARGMTQNDLALATGLSESAIQKMESLRIPITPQHRSSIQHALDAAGQEALEQVAV